MIELEIRARALELAIKASQPNDGYPAIIERAKAFYLYLTMK